MCFCKKKSARVFYWFGYFFIISFSILLAFSIIYLYLPKVANYRNGECHINSCVDTVITCCKTLFSLNQCVTHTYPNITFTLLHSNKIYVKSETHRCDGPLGQNDWVYYQMCQDSNRKKKMSCYYDLSDLPNSLHLTNAYQPAPALGVAAISFCVFMIVCWISYLIFYCATRKKFY